MSGQLSPDGNWLWDGKQWIPAPPIVTASNSIAEPNLLPQISDNNFVFSEQFNISKNGIRKETQTKKLISIAGIIIILLAGLSVWIFYPEDSESCNIRAIQANTDEPIGGIIDSTTSYTYSKDGLLTLREETSWDGAIIDRTTYSYDDVGNLIEEYRVFDSEFSRETMTHDSDGNMLTRDTKDSYSFNDDEREIYSFDNNGKLVEKEIDINIDGTIDQRTAYEYDSNGLEKFSYTDIDMNGDFDTSKTRYYDSNNRLLETKTDDGMDGIVDDITLYRYDSRGNLIEMKSDYGNDGSYEFVSSFTFDNEDRPTQSIMIIDFEGTWLDSRTVTTTSYADDGTYTMTSSTFEGNEQVRTTETDYACIA